MAFKPISQVEVVDPSTVTIKGYAAVYGNEFKYFDPWTWNERRFIVEPGAFDSALERLGDRKLDVYWSHEMHRVQLGHANILRSDSVGLYFECHPYPTLEAVEKLTVMDGRLETGASVQFEFGEIAEDDDGVEHLLSFNALYEVGPCPEGANPMAWAKLVERGSAEEEIEPEEADEAEPELASDDPSLAEEAELAAATWAVLAKLRKDIR